MDYREMKKSGAAADVEQRAQQLVDNGKFENLAGARAYLFEMEPDLADRVREQGTAQVAIEAARKAAPLAGTAAKVETLAKSLLQNGEFPTLQQARAHVYSTQPKFAAAIRDEAAGVEAEPVDTQVSGTDPLVYMQERANAHIADRAVASLPNPAVSASYLGAAETLEAIDKGQLRASAEQRAYVAGAAAALQGALMSLGEDA